MSSETVVGTKGGAPQKRSPSYRLPERQPVTTLVSVGGKTGKGGEVVPAPNRVGLIEVNGQGSVVQFSVGCERLFERLSAEVLGRPLRELGLRLAGGAGGRTVDLISLQQIPHDEEIEGLVEGSDEVMVSLQRLRRPGDTEALIVCEATTDVQRARLSLISADLRTVTQAAQEPVLAIGRMVQVLVHQFDADHAWIWETSETGEVLLPRPKVEAMSAEYQLPAFGHGEMAGRSLALAEPVLYSSTGFAKFSTVPPNGPAAGPAHGYLGAILRLTEAGGAVLMLERSVHSKPWRAFDLRLLEESIQLVSLSFESLRLREKVEEGATYLGNVLESTDIGVLVFDRTPTGHTVSLLNDRLCEFFKLERAKIEGADGAEMIEVLGESIGAKDLVRDLLADPARQHTCDVMPSGERPRVLQMFSTPARDRTGHSFGRLFMFRDITRDREVEQQLLHSQKMESIGTLAGGIAHDFNNLLTTMLGYSELLRREIPESAPAHSKVEQIERSARRAAELTSNLLAFSRRSPTQMKVLNIAQLIHKTMGIIRFSVPSSIDIRLELDESLPCVEGDETQLEQVLLNLVINARDSLPDGKGVITIHTRLGKDSQKLGSGGGGADFVVMEVDDNGMGISQQDLGRIFEPFYTTKEVGRGTGLGLSMVYGIIKQHNGFIEVASTPSLGSTFSIHIPATAKKLPEPETPEKRKARPIEKRHARILVVDDEEDLLEFCAMSLAETCDHVLTATDGIEAVRVVEEYGRKIDLVLLDLTMPRMGGVEAFYRMRKAAPNLKIVISSGYSMGAGVSELMVNGACWFLQKPYTIEGLQRVVDSCLAQ